MTTENQNLSITDWEAKIRSSLVNLRKEATSQPSNEELINDIHTFLESFNDGNITSAGNALSNLNDILKKRMNDSLTMIKSSIDQALHDFQAQYSPSMSNNRIADPTDIKQFIESITLFMEESSMRALSAAGENQDLIAATEKDLNKLEENLDFSDKNIVHIKEFISSQRERIKLGKELNKELITSQAFQDLIAQALNLITALVLTLKNSLTTIIKIMGLNINSEDKSIKQTKIYLTKADIEDLVNDLR